MNVKMFFDRIVLECAVCPVVSSANRVKSGDETGSRRGVQAFFGEGSLKRFPGKN